MSPVATPPGTTLSTPSPTERTDPGELTNDNIQSQPTNVPAIAMSGRPIYLIVATSLKPSMGIGNKGQLPWPPLKSDMAFFKKVTTTPPAIASAPHPDPNYPSPKIRNAVIMGRKTWLSIPEKFRPLKDRINVIVTRGNVDELAGSILDEIEARKIQEQGGSRSGLVMKRQLRDEARDEGREINVLTLAVYDNIIVTRGIGAAVKSLYEGYAKPGSNAQHIQLGKVFVIGGAEVYRTSLDLQSGLGDVRILQTQVRRKDGAEIECDTFFPIDPSRVESSEGWMKVDGNVLHEWTEGVEMPSSNGAWAEATDEMEIRLCGWRRTR